MNNVLIIFNTKAGRRKALKYKKKIIKFFLDKKCGFKFVDIQEFENIDIFPYDTVVVAGGDGTVSKAAQKLINTGKTLGIIPTGTANLLAANLGIPSNLKDSLKIIDSGVYTKIDTVKINDRYCILRFGLGYDFNIISKTPQSLKNKFGYFAYFIAGIIFALRLKLKEYNIISGGKEISEKASCVIIANAANMYENICSVGENSLLTDSLFEIFVLKTENFFVFFYEFFKIILNTKSTNKNVKYMKGVNLTIKSELLNCHIDGEKTKLKGDVNISIVPESLKVFSK